MLLLIVHALIAMHPAVVLMHVSQHTRALPPAVLTGNVQCAATAAQSQLWDTSAVTLQCAQSLE